MKEKIEKLIAEYQDTVKYNEWIIERQNIEIKNCRGTIDSHAIVVKTMDDNAVYGKFVSDLESLLEHI